jgi:hypothetical protein
LEYAAVAIVEYEIEGNTRRCAATGRELQPGETVFTALVDENTKLVRLDFAAESWQGPPPNVFGFWVGQVPPMETRRPSIDDEALFDFFQKLDERGDSPRSKIRYAVALLLLRRKRLRLEGAEFQGGGEILTMQCAKTRARFQVFKSEMSDEEMKSVQKELDELLQWR